MRERATGVLDVALRGTPEEKPWLAGCLNPIMMPVDWVLRHKVASVLAGVAVSVLLWWVLVEYIDPRNATDRKDIVQVFALIIVGLVGALGGIVGIANLQTSRRNVQRQRELEEQRAQEDALRAYFEQTGALLTDHNLISTDREDIQQLAQAQTLTVLARLDGPRKGSLVRFLHGARLINVDKPIVHLIDADLSGVDLSDASLYHADLSGANLRYAELSDANLSEASLSDANLIGAFLYGADLQRADLSGANLRYANLSGANLRYADLTGADLSGANLSNADLAGADLSDAEVIVKQLAACKPLEGTTMPDGQRYEHWLRTTK